MLLKVDLIYYGDFANLMPRDFLCIKPWVWLCIWVKWNAKGAEHCTDLVYEESKVWLIDNYNNNNNNNNNNKEI